MFGEEVILGHKDVGASTAAALGFIVKTGIVVSAEFHVAGAICGTIAKVRAAT